MHAGVKESSEERGKVFRPQHQTFLVIQKRKFNCKIESGEDTRVQCRSSSRRECRLDERRGKSYNGAIQEILEIQTWTFESFLLKYTGR